MKKLIYTSFSPNTRMKDLKLNVRILFSPWMWLRGSCVKNIAQIFENKFSGYRAFTFNYARSGMYILFKSLKLEAGDEVLVQGYTCVAAVNPIIWAGGKVVYVDIDRNSGNMSITDLKNKITKKTRVILFQHTYGGSLGIEDIANMCKHRGITLVEDCTNTIFGKNVDCLIGSYGEASIFSFGRDKAVSGVDGGVILIREDSELNLVSKVTKEYKNIGYPSLGWLFLELIYPILWFFIKTFFNIKVGKLLHLIFTKMKLLLLATSDREKRGLIGKDIPSLLPNSLACLALHQLEDIETLNSHRSKIAEIYINGLSEIESIHQFLSVSGNILLRYPIAVEDRDDLVSFLKKNNTYVGDWYMTPIAPSEVDIKAVSYTEGRCPVSESVCKRILNLPTHINVSEEDATRVVGLLGDYYGNQKNRR